MNPDPAAAVKYVLFDKEKLTLTYFSNTDSAVHTYALNPTEAKWWSIDTLSAKYPNLSPYCFAGNNPIRNVDLDGKDIIVLLDKEGAGRWGITAGHAAMLIGNDKTGWQLVSKNGTTYLLGLNGPSIKHPQLGDDYKTDKKENWYPNLQAFYKDNDSDQLRYEKGFRITSDNITDNKMKEAGKIAAASWYSVIGSSCIDAVRSALKAGDFNTKIPDKITTVGSFEFRTVIESESIYPNTAFWQIKLNNTGTTIDINAERNKIK